MWLKIYQREMGHNSKLDQKFNATKFKFRSKIKCTKFTKKHTNSNLFTSNFTTKHGCPWRQQRPILAACSNWFLIGVVIEYWSEWKQNKSYSHLLWNFKTKKNPRLAKGHILASRRPQGTFITWVENFRWFICGS